jgi:hypothetical protein
MRMTARAVAAWDPGPGGVGEQATEEASNAAPRSALDVVSRNSACMVRPKDLSAGRPARRRCHSSTSRRQADRNLHASPRRQYPTLKPQFPIPNSQFPKAHTTEAVRRAGPLRVGRSSCRVRSGVMSARGAMRAARGVSSKNAPQASQSAEALFRHGPSGDPDAQPMAHQRADHPSRSGHRQDARRRRVFPGVARGATGRHGIARSTR